MSGNAKNWLIFLCLDPYSTQKVIRLRHDTRGLKSGRPDLRFVSPFLQASTAWISTLLPLFTVLGDLGA